MSDPKPNTKPSDLELMMYFDDELEVERRAAVERYLVEDAAGRLKLKGLEVAGAALREETIGSASPADAIADAVMAALEAESRPAPAQLRKQPAVASAPSAARETEPANDNRPLRYVISLVAVAAAAALLVFRNEPAPRTVAAVSTAELVASSAPSASPEPIASAAEVEIEAEGVDPVHGVEVAAVEFGARMGSIFYVAGEDPSAGSSPTTTTVVWLAEEETAGDE